jgi:hypothetical protein
LNVRRGRIFQIELPPTRAKRIARVTLDSGLRVYVPWPILEEALSPRPWGDLMEPIDEAEFVFLEQGLLGRVSWMGRLGEAMDAIARGLIPERAVLAAGLPTPRVASREIRHIDQSTVVVIAGPDAATRRHLEAIASTDAERGGAGRARRVAERWLGEPFEPFLLDVEDWAALDRVIGLAVMPREFRIR